ncbi:MAG: aldehyde ferredoxin oxidoreductase family protein [Candidatus Jordarchaeum sp.]|uniref:aldehyde ferredoxin oxidoreductase family protein n=1 Tax=Candidatus Jordarchaeum sp. TaxID=2823881 RepID=UPI00404A73C9
MTKGGYAGTILKVDLTNESVEKEPLSDEYARRFIGGLGINNKLAWDLIKSDVKPLDPENPLIYGAGPLIGTLAPGTSRLILTTKFPINGAVASACGSMRFAANLKWAGYDHLVITGKARRPVYLGVFDEDVGIFDARDLWGRDIFQTSEKLWKEHGSECAVNTIGPSGENLVEISLSLIDRTSTLGRGGLGAIMGSKNLKAVTVRGTKGVRVFDSKRFLKLVKKIFEKIKSNPIRDWWLNLGILIGWDSWNKAGFAVKNWTEVFPREETSERVGPEVYLSKAKKARIACPSCPMGDKDVLEIKEGEFKGLRTYATSYLNTTFYGLMCEDGSYDKAIKCHDLANRYGLDSLMIANIMEFVLDLYEQGILTDVDLEGMPLKRDFETVLRLIEKINSNEGIGHLLSKGAVKAAQRIGKNSKKYAFDTKGLSIIFDPRINFGTEVFEQIVNPRGAHVVQGETPTLIMGRTPEKLRRYCEKAGVEEEALERTFNHPMGFNVARLTKHGEDHYSVISSLGICARQQIAQYYPMTLCAELFTAATGIEITASELIKTGERIWNLHKIINVREGFWREHDKFPNQWLNKTIKDGDKELTWMDYYKETQITEKTINQLVNDYYDEREWSIERGVPTREKLIKLGLKEESVELEKLGLI